VKRRRFLVWPRPGMRALNRKLLRELWGHRGQMASIAAVVAVGVMVVLTMRGTYEALTKAQQRYYRDARFPHVWAQVERAPESLRRRIHEIPGVSEVGTRVTFAATLDVPGIDAPALGLFVSLPERRRATVGDIHLLSGRYVASSRRSEAIISENFAIANGFVPGDTLRAVINGRRRSLEIVGVAISPEHSYAVPPGSLFPDDERYGILWMSREVLGPVYAMEGSFNEVVLTLSPGSDRNEVISRLDRLLEPYGGLGAFGREDQPSHQILTGELEQNRTMGTVVPAIFLAIAAFLLNVVLGRMIAVQRTEIAVLKAFGYDNVEVGIHYLRFAMAAVAAGAVVGSAAGVWLGGQMVNMYTEYFRFPELRYELSWGLLLIAAGVSVVGAALGALGAVRRAVRLPPAEAMRPEPPARFRPGLLERAGIGKVLPAAGRMILRNLERQPVRALLSAVGVAFSVAILVIGLFMFDGVGYMMDLQFGKAQREDLSVSFNHPLPASVRHDLGHLSGVTRVEAFRGVPVRLRSGHLEEEAGITGLEPERMLRRIITARGGVQPLPPEGLVLSQMLAEKLGVSAGDGVDVEVLEGARRRETVRVTGVVEDFIGVSAYMQLDALHRLARGPEVVTGAFMAVEASARAELSAELKELPVVASVASPADMLRSFEEQLAESLFVSVFFMLAFSGVIAVAVVYNGARIALSERGRELASLRVLGFSQNEVAVLLLGEQGLITLAAIPLGWVIGYLLAAGLVAGVATESYRIPLVVSAQTYMYSAGATLVAAIVSGWIVRRRLDRMDLVEVLKTRE
jgi:putative ABC transport system permease protein